MSRFKDVIFLFFPLLLLFFHWRWRRNRRLRLPAFTFPVPIPNAVRRASPEVWFRALRSLAIVFFCIALARPQWGTSQHKRNVEGIDILITLDVSASMKIEDLADRSRMDVAKDTIEEFIKGRSDDRIGLVAFSGEPLTLAPLTLDYGLVRRALQEVSFGVLRDGTAIGDGLALSVSHLKNSTAKSRVIILLTDGDNNVGQVDPGSAGELARAWGIRVYTIAIGKEGRVRLPIDQQTPFGRTIRTYQIFDNALNPELLKQIAAATQGKFYRVTDEQALGDVFHEIDRMERTSNQSTERVVYEERFTWPLTLGLLFLFAELVLARLWWRFAAP